MMFAAQVQGEGRQDRAHARPPGDGGGENGWHDQGFEEDECIRVQGRDIASDAWEPRFRFRV